jgi:WD40 repeat protein
MHFATDNILLIALKRTKSIAKVVVFWSGFFASIVVWAQDYGYVAQTGHSDHITSMSITYDGKYVVTGSLDETIVSWRLSNQMQIGTVLGLRGGVCHHSYDEKKGYLAVSTYDNQVLIYDYKDSVPGLKHTIHFVKNVQLVHVIPDSKRVLAATGKELYLIDSTGNSKSYGFTETIEALTLNEAGTKAFIALYNGNIYEVTVSPQDFGEQKRLLAEGVGKVTDLDINVSETLLAYGSSASSSTAGTLGIVYLKRNKQDTLQDFSIFFGSRPGTVRFIDNRRILYVNKDQKLAVWNFRRNRKDILIQKKEFDFFEIGRDNQIIGCKDSELHLFSLDNPENTSSLRGEVENPKRIAGVYNHRLMVEYPSGLKEWDLENLKLELYKEKLYEADWDRYTFSRDLTKVGNGLKLESVNYLRYQRPSNYVKARFGALSKDKSYYTFFNEQGKLIVQKYNYNAVEDSLFSKPKYSWRDFGERSWSYDERYASLHINGLVMHPNKPIIAILKEGFDVFNLQTMEIKSENTKVRNSSFSLPAAFDPVQEKLLIATSSDNYSKTNYENEEGYHDAWVSLEHKLAGTEEPYYYNKKGGIISVYNLDTLIAPTYLIRNDYIERTADVSSIVYDSTHSRFLVGYTDGTLKSITTTDSGYYTGLNTRFTSGIKDIAVSEEGSFIFVINQYGGVGVMDKDFNYLLTLFATTNNDYIVVDVEANYKRSKNAQNAMLFTKGEENLRLNQVDNQLNNPHKVYARLGLLTAEKLAIIQQLADRNKEETKVEEGPSIELVNQDRINYITRKSSFKLKLNAVAGDTSLNRFKVWIDGVPIHAEENAPRAKRKHNAKAKLKLPLKRGENAIHVVATDVEGNESNAIDFTVISTKPYVRPNLYVGLVSVSDYEDSTMNLTYAVKDGRDFARAYIDSKGRKQIGFPSRFKHVQIDSFFDGNATRESVLKWKKTLQKTKPEDYVLLFISGHGLLDDNFDFWFATHDVDFDKPANRGLSFEELEGLLVGIPAQQKLILMDACHSGEVLKEELTVDSSFSLPDGSKGILKSYTYKGAGVEGESTSAIDKSELKQELFSNYDSKSGATVISAAAGNSFALESSVWSNGIFTYTIIGGLVNRWADLNNDGDVTVVELSRYVNEEVKKQTAGSQKPNDRQENIQNNFRVW